MLVVDLQFFRFGQKTFHPPLRNFDRWSDEKVDEQGRWDVELLLPKRFKFKPYSNEVIEFSDIGKRQNPLT